MRGQKSLLLLFLILTAPGCIHMYPTRSGYLADYSQLQAIDKKERLQVNPVDAAALANVDSFYLEPVAWLADSMGQPAHNEKVEAAVRNSLYESLAKELSGIRPIVNEVGPRTAVVRSAVTGVREPRPIMNLILTAQIVGPLFNGGASAEIEVIDPQGRQIAAESVGYQGHDWDIVGFFWKRQYSKSAVRRAAEQIAGDLRNAAQYTTPPMAAEPPGVPTNQAGIGILANSPASDVDATQTGFVSPARRARE